ncbi:MAG: rod-binding protein [Planctomycetota bacterium]
MPDELGLDSIASARSTATGNASPKPAPLGESEREERFQEILKAARQLESYFTSQIVQKMRSSLPGEGLFGGGAGSNVFEGLFDQALGEHLAESGRLGLAEMIANQILRRAESDESSRLIDLQRVLDKARERKPEVPAVPIDGLPPIG